MKKILILSLCIVSLLMCGFRYDTLDCTRPTIMVNVIVIESDVEYDLVEIDVLYESSIKSYMDYKLITDKTSPQWKLIRESGEIIVDENGYLTTKDGFIGVAMGSYFGDIGTKYIMELENGEQVKFIIVERKANQDTCKNNFLGKEGAIIEFVIDTKNQNMKNNIYPNGYIWQGNFNNNPTYNGKIVKIWCVK